MRTFAWDLKWSDAYCDVVCNIRDDTHMAPKKMVQFSVPLHLHSLCPPTSKILPPPWSSTSNFKRILRFQMIANQLKENKTQGWLLYAIRSFLQVGFRFQSQLINLDCLPTGFFPFSWSETRNQNNFKKLKTSFSPYLKDGFAVWSQSQKEDFLSKIYYMHDVWSWRISNCL